MLISRPKYNSTNCEVSFDYLFLCYLPLLKLNVRLTGALSPGPSTIAQIVGYPLIIYLCDPFHFENKLKTYWCLISRPKHNSTNLEVSFDYLSLWPLPLWLKTYWCLISRPKHNSTNCGVSFDYSSLWPLPLGN